MTIGGVLSACGKIWECEDKLRQALTVLQVDLKALAKRLDVDLIVYPYSADRQAMTQRLEALITNME